MKIYAQSSKGKVREKNEDNYKIKVFKKDGIKSMLFLVADGLGGHNKGEVASEMCVESIVEYLDRGTYEDFYSCDNPVIVLEESIRYANTKIFEKSLKEPTYLGMGTTLVLAYIIGNQLYVLNVGDSRSYIYREEELTQITKDNSLVQELIEIGEINEEEAKNHFNRNVITRAIGLDPKVKIDNYHEELSKDDAILLCSDGLTNMVSDEKILEIISLSEGPEEIVEKLIDEANLQGGKDNITVIGIVY